MNHAEREFVEDSSDSWGCSDEDVTEPVQMGTSVINSDYESKELHSLENHHLMMILGMILMMALKMN